MIDDYQNYWSGDHGVRMISPDGPLVSPNMGDVSFIQRKVAGKVCDYGCGVGRWAQFFPPYQYVGVDVNRTAVDKARQNFPEYEFHSISYLGELPDADTYMLYTVALHIPDNALEQFLSRFKNRVIIAECMDPKYRNNRFNNQREKLYYINTMKKLGFELTTAKEDERRPFTVLVFDKETIQ